MILQCNGLTEMKRDGTFLDDVSFSVESGSVLGILGKSTDDISCLLAIVSGFLRPDRGSVRIGNCSDMRKNRAAVSFVPNKNFYEAYCSVGDIVNEYGTLFIGYDRQKAFEALETYRISSGEKIRNLSVSECEIFRFVLGSCKNSDIYVYDEPLKHLENVERIELFKRFFTRNSSAYIIGTRNPVMLESVVTDVCFLYDGKIKLNASVKELTSVLKKSVETVFFEVYK